MTGFPAAAPAADTAAAEGSGFAALYREAFARFGPVALWNLAPAADPSPADAHAITQALRVHGGMDGRRLAEAIEAACSREDARAAD